MIGAIIGSLAEAKYHVPEQLTSLAKPYLPEEMLNIINQFNTKIQ